LEQSQDKETIRRAQGLTGELVWLAIRTGPDLSFVVSLISRLATTCSALGFGSGRLRGGHQQCYVDLRRL